MPVHLLHHYWYVLILVCPEDFAPKLATGNRQLATPLVGCPLFGYFLNIVCSFFNNKENKTLFSERPRPWLLVAYCLLPVPKRKQHLALIYLFRSVNTGLCLVPFLRLLHLCLPCARPAQRRSDGPCTLYLVPFKVCQGTGCTHTPLPQRQS